MLDGGRRGVGGSCAVDGCRAAQRSTGCGASGGEAEAIAAGGLDRRDDGRIDCCTTSGARTAEPLAVVRAPWRSRRAASHSLVTAFAGPPPRLAPLGGRPSRLAPALGRGEGPRQPAHSFRRLASAGDPRGGVTSSTTPPTILSPPEVRRRTNRSPGLAATAVASRTIPAADPSGSSIASRPVRPTAPSTAAVPIWTRARARSGSARARRTSSRSVATTAGSSVTTRPRPDRRHRRPRG